MVAQPPHQLPLTAPLASFEAINLDELNASLAAWGHKLGQLRRPFAPPVCHGLFHHGELVAVTAASSLIPAELCGLTRQECVELSRLCAARPDLCRVALRLWREFWLRESGYRYAISYQDEQLHTGRTYRFDGWKVLTRTRSGIDGRSGVRGRNKTVWYYDTQG
jgi:antitoxin VapB